MPTPDLQGGGEDDPGTSLFQVAGWNSATGTFAESSAKIAMPGLWEGLLQTAAGRLSLKKQRVQANNQAEGSQVASIGVV